MLKIILLVVLGIFIIKNIIDKQKEIKALKQLSEDFDNYQSDCKILNDSLNEEVQKVEDEFTEYSGFISNSISEIVDNFNSVVDLADGIVDVNLSMLHKIEVLEHLLNDNKISIENKEMVNLISILKEDILQNNEYSEQLRKEMTKKYSRFSKMEETHKRLSPKHRPPPSKELDKSQEKHLNIDRSDDYNIEP